VCWFLANFYDRVMRRSEEEGLGAWRAELLGPLEGTVLEVGAGTGANLPHFPERLGRLVLTEPDKHMRRRLLLRLRALRRKVDVIAAPVERLPFPGATFDAVVVTLVLCSVERLDRALHEIRRVLKPGGRLVFIEHVAATDRPGRLAWQRLLEPFWLRLTSNCHLTRRTDEAIRAAGFELERLTRASMRKALPWVRPTVRGCARAPA
jgi:ubiquinone/menaquinone biosynthesis C-methylase UbiE